MPAVATRGDGAVSILPRMGEVLNAVILAVFGVAVIAAQHVYSLTAWPCPGLIDR